MLLLAGSGVTAHIYDEFAPKLTDVCHMYGITRRGFGASDHPATGYNDQRLANDVVAIIEAMPIAKPVLVGHSAAGNEMTTVASQHPDLASGLIWKQQRGRTCSRDLADEDQVSEVLQRALS